jgi:hypothetical protein
MVFRPSSPEERVKSKRDSGVGRWNTDNGVKSKLGSLSGLDSDSDPEGGDFDGEHQSAISPGLRGAGGVP